MIRLDPANPAPMQSEQAEQIFPRLKKPMWNAAGEEKH
jgi:hypothetical protein